MNLLLREFLQPLTAGSAGFIIVGSLFVFWSMWRSATRARAALRTLALEEQIVTRGPNHAVQRCRVEHPLKTDRRWLLRKSLDEIFEDWIEKEVLQGRAFEAGPWITGAALFFTFFLIALVLAQSVGPAIQHAGAGIKDLSDAVSTMGAKFVVSMAGVLMSIVHGVLRNHYSNQLYRIAHDTVHRLRPSTVTLEAYQVECTDRSVEAAVARHRAAELHHCELMERTNQSAAALTKIQDLASESHAQHEAFEAKLFDAIAGLRSIEVSIQGIGTNLAQSLQHTVKKDLVEGIGRELRDMADDLQAALSKSFNASLSEQMSVVVNELAKIERAVASQARDQVGELLAKLGDAVSGGFTTESANMKAAMTSFVEVVPKLEAQLRTLITSAGEDISRRGLESVRASEALVTRLDAVLASIEAQQRAGTDMSKSLQEFATSTQQSLAQTVADANHEITQRSRASFDELSRVVNAATSQASEVYGSLVSHVEHAATSLRQTRSETLHSDERLRESARLLHDILVQLRAYTDNARGVTDSVMTALGQARQTVESSADVIKASRETAEQQQALLKELVDRWPALAKRYLDMSDQSFDKIAASWTTQANAIQKSVGHIAEGVASHAAAFADAVEELGQQLSRVPGVANKSRTPMSAE